MWSGHYLVDPWDPTGLVSLEKYPRMKAYFEKHGAFYYRNCNIANAVSRPEVFYKGRLPRSYLHAKMTGGEIIVRSLNRVRDRPEGVADIEREHLRAGVPEELDCECSQKHRLSGARGPDNERVTDV